ncbi:MAG: hypothetical protein WA602_18980, partial [Silvibacterium sp.]
IRFGLRVSSEEGEDSGPGWNFGPCGIAEIELERTCKHAWCQGIGVRLCLAMVRTIGGIFEENFCFCRFCQVIESMRLSIFGFELKFLIPGDLPAGFLKSRGFVRSMGQSLDSIDSFSKVFITKPVDLSCLQIVEPVPLRMGVEIFLSSISLNH